MEYIIKIDTGNAAFGENNSADEAIEVARILMGYANAIKDGEIIYDISLKDINGNKTGTVEKI
mgnify:CR=1 FL=1